MYKLVCIDMDGTLLNDKKNISDENIQALLKAQRKGVSIVICTGRLFAFADFYSNMIGIRSPLICSNGAYIIEVDKGQVIYKKPIDINSCRKINDILIEYDITAVFNTDKIVLADEFKYSAQAYQRINASLPIGNKIEVEIVQDWEGAFNKYQGDILKCIASDGDISKIARVKEIMKRIEGVEVVSSLENNFEVMAKGVSKGRAVEVLSKHFNINREDIVCIGDNENDISMIKYAGLGIVMGNGTEEIKALADFITDTNNNNGVAKALERFIL